MSSHAEHMREPEWDVEPDCDECMRGAQRILDSLRVFDLPTDDPNDDHLQCALRVIEIARAMGVETQVTFKRPIIASCPRGDRRSPRCSRRSSPKT